jgi:hypothetical protein
MRVDALLAILQTLPADAICFANRLGNLNVYTTGHIESDHNPDLEDWKWVGYVELGDAEYVPVE